MNMTKDASINFQTKNQIGDFVPIEFGSDKASNKALVQTLGKAKKFFASIFCKNSKEDIEANMEYLENLVSNVLEINNARVIAKVVDRDRVSIAMTYAMGEADVNTLF